MCKNLSNFCAQEQNSRFDFDWDFCTICALAQMVEWYTRRSQNPLPHGLRVQVPLWAPE